MNEIKVWRIWANRPEYHEVFILAKTFDEALAKARKDKRFEFVGGQVYTRIDNKKGGKND